jgi:hypothetical protein
MSKIYCKCLVYVGEVFNIGIIAWINMFMMLLHGCKWFFNMHMWSCIFFQQLNNVGVKWGFTCGNWDIMLELKVLFICWIGALSEPRMVAVSGDKVPTPCFWFEIINCNFLWGLVDISAWLYVSPNTLIVCDVIFTTTSHGLWSLMALTLEHGIANTIRILSFSNWFFL